MEICPVSGPLRLGKVTTTCCIIIKRPQSSLFCSSPCFPSTNLRYSESKNQMFILGTGFVGHFFAQHMKTQGWIVSGTCTSIAKKNKLEELGLNAHVFDANEPQPEVLDILRSQTHLLVSIPPVVGIGDPLLQHGELLKTRLMGGNLQWLCYLSTTSVYGNCGGALVDELYPITPTSESAKARLAAEEGWLNLGHDLGFSAQIFRLGGIYGPGRSAIDTIVKRGHLSDVQRMRSSKKYTSRIHVADICQAIDASIYNPSPGKVYNIVDDDPAPRAEVFAYARNLVEKKWPGRIKEVGSPDRAGSLLVKESSRGEKRVSNTRLKKEVGVQLVHPNYKSGLQSIIDDMDE